MFCLRALCSLFFPPSTEPPSVFEVTTLRCWHAQKVSTYVINHGNLRGPHPQCHGLFPRLIAGLIKAGDFKCGWEGPLRFP